MFFLDIYNFYHFLLWWFYCGVVALTYTMVHKLMYYVTSMTPLWYVCEIPCKYYKSTKPYHGAIMFFGHFDM